MFEQEIERLNSMALKLNQLFYSSSEVDKAALNSLLDELNSLQYRFFFMQDQKPDKLILVIFQLCTLISNQDGFLVAKHCQLIHQIISTQHIVLNDATLKITLQWCHQALSNSPNISMVDILLALNTLITSHVTSPVVTSASGSLFDTLILSNTENTDIFLFCMKCLNSLMPHLSADKLDLLGSQILNHLYSLHPCSHFLLITLRSVCQYHSSDWITSQLGSLISTVLAYAKYDLPGYVFSQPQAIFPSPGFQLMGTDTSPSFSASKAVSSFKTRTKNKKKNKDKEDEEIVIVSANSCNTQSDSEYSDSEISRLKKVNAGVRLSCFKLLATILDKVQKKAAFGYISTLTLGTESLASCLHAETSAKCRVAILDALIQIFTYSKPFLAMAQIENKSGPSSFVSFASLLTDVVLSVHNKVLQCLYKEQYASVIIHLLKCIDTLAINAPYEKLKGNYSKQLSDAVFPFLSHRDANIIAVALTCFSDMTVLCSDEVLVNLCLLVLSKLQSEDTLVPVLVECWQLISVIAKQRVVLFIHNKNLWSSLIRLLDLHLSKERASNLVQLHAVIAAQNLCQNLHQSESGSQHCDQLWSQLMERRYFISLQEKGAECPTLLTAICDCLATMKPSTYEKLERAYQRTCLVILFGHCSHEESVVRAAAVRALAIYSQFEYEDAVFIADVADTLVRCVRDEKPLVRCKAAWSLGNLSDTMVNHPEAGSYVNLHSLLQACIHCCEDSERIRSNAVRPLGIYLKLLDRDQVNEEEYKNTIGKSVTILTRLASGGTNMKIKWNACYALGHILCNSSIMHLPLATEWRGSIWSCFESLLPSVSNFKVKISICSALCSLTSRDQYEHFFVPMLSTVLASFEVVRTHTYDIHIGGLKVTLYKTLCHFLLLLDPVDLTDVKLVEALRARADEVSQVGESEREEVKEMREKVIEKIDTICADSESLSLLRKMFARENLDGL